MNEKIIKEIQKFVADRDWDKHHNPKDLALSVTLEASELLENFQWISAEKAVERNKKNIEEEIADVMIYSIMLARKLDIDVEDAILSKIKKNAEKYPVDEKHEF